MKKLISDQNISGHSYLPCDQDFSFINSKKKKTSNAETPKEWDIILSSKKQHRPFTFRKMYYASFKDMKNIVNQLTFLNAAKPPHKFQNL